MGTFWGLTGRVVWFPGDVHKDTIQPGSRLRLAWVGRPPSVSITPRKDVNIGNQNCRSSASVGLTCQDHGRHRLSWLVGIQDGNHHENGSSGAKKKGIHVLVQKNCREVGWVLNKINESTSFYLLWFICLIWTAFRWGMENQPKSSVQCKIKKAGGLEFPSWLSG